MGCAMGGLAHMVVFSAHGTYFCYAVAAGSLVAACPSMYQHCKCACMTATACASQNHHSKCDCMTCIQHVGDNIPVHPVDMQSHSMHAGHVMHAHQSKALHTTDSVATATPTHRATSTQDTGQAALSERKHDSGVLDCSTQLARNSCALVPAPIACCICCCSCCC